MSKFLLGLLVLVAGVAIGWYVLKGNIPGIGGIVQPTPTGEQAQVSPTSGPGGAPTASTPGVGQTGEAMEKGGGKERVVVTYTDSGFAPSPVTVKAGVTVTFVNESSRDMWVASAVHPTHQLLPGFDQLKSVVRGGTYEYTFTKVGTWKYHNHTNPVDTGSVVVSG